MAKSEVNLILRVCLLLLTGSDRLPVASLLMDDG
jgi:hypothetical protein